ncbi:hypothetical protein OHV05_20780 [Kitasatospora sp. NBC_00070]|uniref:hypothetical protein n=1 Tax=Kitasatospora sp. NBC_00070 TaxID=2975962 RepID=UPI00324AE7CE
MTRRGLALAFAIPLSVLPGAGVAHAEVCTSMATGTYRTDGVYGQVPQVRMGGSRTVDNVLTLDAPDQGSAVWQLQIVSVDQQTPGPAPSARLSVDGGPAHGFSFTWQPPRMAGTMGSWVSDEVRFGGLSRGRHVLHETLSMPVGSPNGVYELSAMAALGPCSMITVSKLGGVSFSFTGGSPAQPATPAPAGTTRKPTPRATPTAKPASPPQATTSPTPPPSPTPEEPSPAPTPTPTPSASPTPEPSPTPTVTPTPSPTPVTLAATPAGHSGSGLPWALGALVAVAGLGAGGVLVVRRRRDAAAGGAQDGF